MTTYTLSSSAWCSAPGMIPWAIAKYREDTESGDISQALVALDIIKCWEMPDRVAKDLAVGRIEYRIEGDKVVFEVEA